MINFLRHLQLYVVERVLEIPFRVLVTRDQYLNISNLNGACTFKQQGSSWFFMKPSLRIGYSVPVFLLLGKHERTKHVIFSYEVLCVQLTLGQRGRERGRWG